MICMQDIYLIKQANACVLQIDQMQCFGQIQFESSGSAIQLVKKNNFLQISQRIFKSKQKLHNLFEIHKAYMHENLTTSYKSSVN